MDCPKSFFMFQFCNVLNSIRHEKASTKTIELLQPISWMEFRIAHSIRARTKFTTAHLANGFNEDVLHYPQWMTKWKHLKTESRWNKTNRKRKRNDDKYTRSCPPLILFGFMAAEHAKYVCWTVVTYFNFNCLTDRNHQINSRISKIPREMWEWEDRQGRERQNEREREREWKRRSLAFSFGSAFIIHLLKEWYTYQLKRKYFQNTEVYCTRIFQIDWNLGPCQKNNYFLAWPLLWAWFESSMPLVTNAPVVHGNCLPRLVLKTDLRRAVMHPS